MGRPPTGTDLSPPAFLRLAGHPLRWRLLAELAGSDRQVHELVALLGQPQNLVSYHLGQLRSGRLVATRRSAADRRDTYYMLDLARCGELLTATGAALHPAFAFPSPSPSGPPPRLAPPPVPARRGRARVLFACTGNSARSQMAEALLRHLARGAVWVASAGSRPKAVHPYAVAAMAERGIDLAGARAKHLDGFVNRRLDYVVTLCDRVREVCPDFGSGPRAIHWSIPDPSQEADAYPAFQRTAAELETRIRFLQYRLSATPTPESEEVT
jgi:ArsR family transcriptional regulator, arsenate/arsenite/antimonite-responsive transcriptional repressor / arsenate reductase (thioredoxin)